MNLNIWSVKNCTGNYKKKGNMYKRIFCVNKEYNNALYIIIIVLFLFFVLTN